MNLFKASHGLDLLRIDHCKSTPQAYKSLWFNFVVISHSTVVQFFLTDLYVNQLHTYPSCSILIYLFSLMYHALVIVIMSRCRGGV